MRLKVFSILLLITLNTLGHAQSIDENIRLIENNSRSLKSNDNNYRTTNQVNDQKVLQYRHRSIVSKYNPLSLLATSSMYIYQNIVSPQLFRHCLYHRSCSNYSKAAINEFGLIKGVFISADRLLRCNVNAINDIPPEDFDSDGFAIDEPSKYHFRK
jgi:uncharacterized protein